MSMPSNECRLCLYKGAPCDTHSQPPKPLRFVATFTVSETGSVTTETYVSASEYTVMREISTYGSPYLGDFISSESWREALAEYAVEMIANRYSVGGCHGHVLKYVDEACSVYVFEVDFDRPNPQQ